MAEESSIKELIPQGIRKVNLFENINLTPIIFSGNHLDGEESMETIDLLNSNIELIKETSKSSNPNEFADSIHIVGKFFAAYSRTKSYGLYGIKTGSDIDIKIHNFLDFGTSFLDNNITRIENEIDHVNLQSQENLLSAVTFLGRVSEGPIQEKAVGFLLNHFESIARKEVELIKIGKDSFGDTSRFKSFNFRLPILDTILEFGNTSQVETGKKVIIKLLHDKNPAVRKLAAYSIPLWTSDYDPARRKVLEDLISLLGVNGQEAILKWKAALPRDKDPERTSISENLLSLLALEDERPGIGTVLQSEFGINDFSRYPQELLIAQYDERDTKDNMPHGTIIYPVLDHNGAFYVDVEVFRKLFNQLNGRCRLRVWEVNNVTDMLGALNTARHKYGPISFAIIGGHGEPNNIRFGGKIKFGLDIETRTGEVLDQKKHVERRGASSIRLAFVKEPTIILASCSTGKYRGIAQEISKIGGRVIGPSVDANFKNIDANFSDDGKIGFIVEYGTDTASNTYTSGKLKKKTS